jgi:hypothetical protein
VARRPLFGGYPALDAVAVDRGTSRFDAAILRNL